MKRSLQNQKGFYNQLYTTQDLIAVKGGLHGECRRRAILGFVEHLKLKNPQILELGCGLGYLANQLSCIGNVTGIDLSDKAIELAKTRYPHVSFFAGDFLEMAIEKNKFLG